MSAPSPYAHLRRRAAGPALFAVASIVVLVALHVAGGLRLSFSVRIGIGALGLAVLWPVAGALLGLLDRDGDDWTGAPLPRPVSTLRERIAARRSGLRPASRREVEELSLLLRLSAESPADFHVRVKPRLAAVVRHRLGAAGVDVADADAVRSAFGDLAVSLLDDTSRIPRDPKTPGVPPVVVRDLLRRAEESS